MVSQVVGVGTMLDAIQAVFHPQADRPQASGGDGPHAASSRYDDTAAADEMQEVRLAGRLPVPCECAALTDWALGCGGVV